MGIFRGDVGVRLHRFFFVVVLAWPYYHKSHAFARQNYSWLSAAPPSFAGSTRLVRQATQLHRQAPQMDLSQSSGLPCCGGDMAGQAAFSLQPGCRPHARPALPTLYMFRACCRYTRRSARHGRLARSHAERTTGKGNAALFASVFGPPVPCTFRKEEFFLDTNWVGGLQLPRLVKIPELSRRKQASHLTCLGSVGAIFQF